MTITAARLREVLNYDPTSGAFTWAVNRKKCTVGDRAGSLRADGYVTIRIDYQRFYAHRLAWLYMTGEWPSGIVDHSDGVPSNNSWANLRLADPAQSSANRGMQTNNTVGFKGVRRQSDGKYYAMIMARGQSQYLGRYDTPEAAADAYAIAAQRLHGEFARSS